jgi:hypothetical protein
MKRALTLVIALLVITAMLMGCSSAPAATPTTAPAAPTAAAPAPAAPTAAPAAPTAAAAAPTTAAPAAAKDTVIIAMSADPGSLDPQLRDEAQQRLVTDNICDSLLSRDTKTM